MRIGIFGGTFNPIHLGHLIVAEEVRQNFELQRIIFVPSARPPHKPSPGLAGAEHRLEMTRLATEGNPYFDVSSIELKRSGFSFSVETIDFFQKEFGKAANLFFILGIDAFTDIDSWHDPQRLLSLCQFIVISRPGFSLDKARLLLSETFGINAAGTGTTIPLPHGHELHLAEVTPVGISSTRIRTLIRERRSLKYLLPETVESYILLHDLYKPRD